VLGHRVKQAGVLYVTYEADAELPMRLAALKTPISKS